MISIIIADDHKLFREGLTSLLHDENDLKVVGHANNGKELLQLLYDIVPNVILLDVNMPEYDGFSAITELHKLYPQVRVIVLSMHDEPSFIMHFIQNGASSYLYKNSDPEEVVHAIRTCMEKGSYINEQIGAMIAAQIAKRETGKSKNEVKLEERDIRLLQLICEEKSSKEIADELLLSHRTVEGLKQKLYDKLGIKTVAGLVKYAVRNGIIQ
ncbi:MAG: response regulator [Flavobacteriales bacterium]|jgi:DNA-binding NarL/FixJ family response regulator